MKLVPGRSTGRPLWVSLTIALLVPLLGLGVFVVVLSARASAAAGSAVDAEEAVRAASALAAAAAAVDQEILPAAATTMVEDPGMLAALGIPDSMRQYALDQVGTLKAAARAATDAALERAVALPAAAAAATAAGTDLRRLRADADTATSTRGLLALHPQLVAVAQALADAQRSVVAGLPTTDISPATAHAVQDVDAVGRYVHASSSQLPGFLAAALGLLGEAADQRTTDAQVLDTWTAVGRTLDRAGAGLDLLDGTELRDRWAALQVDPDVLALDATITATADRPALPATTALAALVEHDRVRNAAAADLLDAATGLAVAAGEADAAAARTELVATLTAGGLLTVLASLVAWRVSRGVTRSLAGVADAAGQISQGELVDVPVAGPREVRVVGGALADAVGSLRQVQHQAGAVARGELDDPALATTLPGPLGQVVHGSVVQLVRSVQARDRLQTELVHQASHDPLTDLPNRHQATVLTEAALARAQRAGTMVGMLFVDLDGFKAVNDRFGHAAGDEVLREVSRRLRDGVRGGDSVCRLGGDEFVALVEAVADERTVLALADRLVGAVSEPVQVRSASGAQVLVSVGASIGVAVHQDGGLDAEALLAQADAAAYLAKHRGKGRVEVFDDSLRQRIEQKRDLEDALAAGIERGELRLRYQPVVDVVDGALVGYEALVRWERPGHGTVVPDDFIPVAEESDLVCTLDRWVLHRAFDQLTAWRATNPDARSRTMAVNVSGRHLADPRVVEHVREALAATGLPAHLVVLEVTETVLVDSPTALEHMAQLRALGVAVAIDDFGTGYTSIGQLGALPIDTLKIDRSFVAADDPASRSLLNLMIRTAHTLGLTVVGEGVERMEDLEALRAEGCHHAQGYLMARPLTVDDAGEVFPGDSSLVPGPAVPGPRSG